MRSYTKEEEDVLIEEYLGGKTVEDLAAQFDRSERSIINKLCHLRIYVKPIKEQKETNKVLFKRLENLLGVKFESSDLSGSEDIKMMLECIKKLHTRSSG